MGKIRAAKRFDFARYRAQNETNVTRTNRTLEIYSSILFSDPGALKAKIIEHAKSLGRKITILDSGCGKGAAIDGILSDDELKPYVRKVIGVSKDYFSDIEQLSQKHGRRFDYYKARAHLALRSNIRFDFAIDMWGSYAYSANKLSLFQLLHQCAEKKAQIVLFQPRPERQPLTRVRDMGQLAPPVKLESFLSDKLGSDLEVHPLYNGASGLFYQKNQDRFGASGETSYLSRGIKTTFTPKKNEQRDLVGGNGAVAKEVVISYTARRSLRAL